MTFLEIGSAILYAFRRVDEPAMDTSDTNFFAKSNDKKTPNKNVATVRKSRAE
jgi:hypothetical protein